MRTFRGHGKNFTLLISMAGVAQPVVLEYEADGTVNVLLCIPSLACKDQCAGQSYARRTRIVGQTPSPEALQRYGPLRRCGRTLRYREHS
jgi:hypothetical protein